MKSSQILDAQHKNVKALFYAIWECEGKPKANQTFNYKNFTDLSWHPNILVNASGHSSTAAGMMQILYKTWQETAPIWGIKDFTEESQKLWFVKCITYRRSCIDDAIAGNWDNVLSECALEWASLPCPGLKSICIGKHSKNTSHYGQGGKTKQQFLNLIKQYGGTI